MFYSLLLLVAATPSHYVPSADSELKASLSYIQSRVDAKTLAAYDAHYLKFFTTYSLPRELRKDAELSLSFVLNSCANFKSSGYIERPKKVPESETLYYIDIRDYGWGIKDFETIYSLQAYFLDPVVDHKLYNYGRILAGNVMFRADWFIANALDASLQIDRGIDDIVYYTLLYGKGNEPKNADDFRKFWRVDIKTIRQEKIEKGTVVDKKDSGVSKRTRQLRRARSIFGYYWETRDVLSFDDNRDFVEDVEASNYNASEFITSAKNGLQVYMLSTGTVDAKGKPDKNPNKRVDIADPGVVIDRGDPHDPRVRTAISCVNCHPTGINPATNKVREILERGGKLYAKYDDLKQEIKAFYLRNLNSDIEDDCRLYERAVRECNGLDPIENAKTVNRIYQWYKQDVSLEQAAREFGMTTDMYKKELKVATTGRLVDLYYNGVVPREVWDSLKNGAYIQSALLIKRVENQPLVKQAVYYQINNHYNTVPLQADSKTILVYIPRGEHVEFVSIYADKWYKVRYKQHTGYIHTDYLKQE